MLTVPLDPLAAHVHLRHDGAEGGGERCGKLHPIPLRRRDCDGEFASASRAHQLLNFTV